MPVLDRKKKIRTENFPSNLTKTKLYIYILTVCSFVFVGCLLNLGARGDSEAASTQMFCLQVVGIY